MNNKENQKNTASVTKNIDHNKVMNTVFFDVEWGDKSWKKVEDISLKYKDLAIKNRFDFGEETQMIIRNTKPIKKPLPNIFKLLKISKKQEV